jgi:diguanylate cyclase (GGDEF)-like protein
MRILSEKHDIEYWQYSRQANIVYLSTLFSYILILPLFYFVGNMMIFYINFYTMFITLFVIYLNRNHRYGYASFIFITMVTIVTSMETIAFGLESGFGLFHLNMAVLIVYTNWKNKYRFIGVVLQGAIFIATFFYLQTYPPLTMVEPHFIQIFFVMNVFLNITAVAHSAYYYENIAKRNRSLLEEIAQQDHLTGLPNRLSLNQYLTKTLDKDYKGLGVMMIDIDHFKNINDTYGHLVGDEVLIKMAELLKKGMREDDLVVRYGGEEFLVIMEMERARFFREKAQRLLELIQSTPFETANQTLKITVSIGAFYNCCNIDLSLEECIRNADNFLYQAKEQGRNQVVNN